MQDQDGNSLPTMQQIIEGTVIEIMECQRGDYKTTLSKVEHHSGFTVSSSFIVTGPTISLLFVTNDDIEAVDKFHSQTEWIKEVIEKEKTMADKGDQKQ